LTNIIFHIIVADTEGLTQLWETTRISIGKRTRHWHRPSPDKIKGGFPFALVHSVLGCRRAHTDLDVIR